MCPRVLVVTPCYPRFPGDFNGGFVRDLCLRLAARGVDLSVLAPRSRTMGDQTAPYPVRRFPYLPLNGLESLPEETMKGAPMGRLAQLPPYMVSCLLHASAAAPELIHSHLAIPLGFVASLVPVKAPRIVTCHGSDCTLPLDNPAYLPFTRHTLRQADAVVAVSRYVEGLARRLGARNAETIYLGVDTRRFRPPRDRSEHRARVGIPEDALVVGTMGRLVREKRIVDLLEASELVSKKLDATFLIGGDGSEKRSLEAFTRERGLRNVFFMGTISDAPSFLGLLDVFVLASSREGLSLSLQEAMAAGCVPVAAEGHGSEELITDGRNGFLYSDGPTDLAGRIIEASNAPSMGVRARETIVDGFDAEAGADRYAELYNRLAF
jgi:glycosyltransferase involved in cell wall biosynthesis